MKPEEKFIEAIVKLINDKELQKSILGSAEKHDYKQLKQEASKELKEIREQKSKIPEERQKVLTQAHNEAARIIRQAEESVEKKITQMASREEKMREKSEALAKKSQDIDDRMKKVINAEQLHRDATKLMTEAEKIKQAYSEKYEKLQQAMG